MSATLKPSPICPPGQHDWFVLVAEIMDVPNKASIVDTKEPAFKTVVVTRRLACTKCPTTMNVQA